MSACSGTPQQQPYGSRPGSAASSYGTPFPHPGQPLYSPPGASTTAYVQYPPQQAYPPNQDFAFAGYPSLDPQPQQQWAGQSHPQQHQGYGQSTQQGLPTGIPFSGYPQPQPQPQQRPPSATASRPSQHGVGPAICYHPASRSCCVCTTNCRICFRPDSERNSVATLC